MPRTGQDRVRISVHIARPQRDRLDSLIAKHPEETRSSLMRRALRHYFELLEDDHVAGNSTNFGPRVSERAV